VIFSISQLAKVMITAPISAAVKLATLKPSITEATNQNRNTFTNKPKRPKLIRFNGSVIIRSIGFTAMLINEKRTAAIIADRNPPMLIPETNSGSR